MAKVLVIDDSPTIAAMFQRLFAQQGHQVHVAGDGRSGIELARQQSPDLIVLDQVLPDTDGFQVCRALRTEQPTVPSSILILTGSSDERLAELGKEAGADAYLTKDCGLPRIFEVANSLLSEVAR